MEPGVLSAVLEEADQVWRSGRLEMAEELSEATQRALSALKEACVYEPEPLDLADRGTPESVAEMEGELVIAPGSVGWIVTDDNQEFVVERVFYHPREGLRYFGHRQGQENPPNLKVWFPVDNIRPIPGVSRMAMYDYETGEVRPIEG